MIKALHLISDPKFTDIHIARFNDPDFDNRFIYLAADFQYSGPNLKILEWIIPFSPSYETLRKAAGDFDLIFVYHLDYIKSCFINGIPAGLLVLWHLYGTELYNNFEPFRYSIYSAKTKKIVGITQLTILAARCKRFLSRIKYKIINKRADYDEIRLAISRINFLAWYSKSEYDFLQTQLKITLPPFLELSVLVKEPATEISAQTPSGGIWLGNSASPENNHVDVITLLQNFSFKELVILPFSYGGNKSYVHFIKDVKKKTALKIELLENFDDYETFSQKLANCRAAVFNSYRQMALGNIFLAFQFGLKIYMNELNPSFEWLTVNGFHLYSIQHNLIKDIQSNSLALSPEEIKINQEACIRLTSDRNNKLFLKHISALVHDGKNN